MIRCDFQFLKDNYILLFNGINITDDFIRKVALKGFNRVIIKDGYLSYDNETFKPIYATVFNEGILCRDKIIVLNRYCYTSKYNYMNCNYIQSNKTDNNQSNKTDNKFIKLWKRLLKK